MIVRLGSVTAVGALGAIFAAAFISCGEPPVDSPPQVRWGEDACDECHMLLSEPRYAVVARLVDGTERRFDDVGDAAAYLAAHPAAGARLWVHEFEGDRWLAADTARFVTAERFATPMGHRIVAFADASRAEALARESRGRTLNWSEVLAAGRGGVSKR